MTSENYTAGVTPPPPPKKKKKAERSVFVILTFENTCNIFFISSGKTLSSEKNDTKIIEICWV